MGHQSLDDKNDEPFDYFSEGKAGKQKENSGLDSLISTIRSDPILTTDTEPARKNILEQVNLKVLVGILLGGFIVILLIFLIFGAGRKALEHNLAAIVHSTETSTPTSPPSSTAVGSILGAPTSTLAPSATPQPTLIPTQAPTPTAAAELAQATATTSGCREALTITLADVGQTLCVKGTVIETVDNPNAFMVVFSNQPGSFYWVSYDMVWSQAELNTCYQTTGMIQQIANSPILLFDYSNIPEVCP
jgi:hypothetical protein